MATVHRVTENQTGLKHPSTHTHTSERSQSEKAAPSDSTYMTFWTEQSYGDSRKTSVCRGYREEGKKFYRTLLRKESLSNE